MVKIVNVLGDVKVGKQGTAIYQRKYGRQIRSITSTMRGIPSQRQLEHRQLYRDALNWRKQLSLPNRRYLDGYPIANGIVDSYGIPLSWSRYALKLYLEHIKFAIISKPVMVYYPPPTLYLEQQNQGTTGLPMYQGSYERVGQLMTISNRHVKKLAWELQGWGTVTGGVFFTIRKTSDDSIIQSKLLGDASILRDSWDWWEVEFDNPPLINEEVRILCEWTGGDASNYVSILYESSNVKADEHLTRWTPSSYNNKTNWDSRYKYWYFLPNGIEGEPDYENSTKGLLHVRHPALMSGEHRRNGQLKEQWTYLSSLDDEYLTGQVGIDYYPNDEIKFTTIAGIEYPFIAP